MPDPNAPESGHEQLIIGPGAVGTVLAAYLARAGHTVRMALLDEHVAGMRTAKQITLDGVPGSQPIVAAKPLMSIGIDLADVQHAFLCVKHPDLPSVLDALDGRVPAHTTLIPCQNGVGVAAQLRNRLDTEAQQTRVAALTVMFNAQLLEPLHARISTRPHVLVNSADKELLSLFDGSGMRVERVRDDAAAWGKLLVNLVSAPCALTRSTYLDVLQNSDLTAIYVAALDEATRALDAANAAYTLPGGLPWPVYKALLTRGGAVSGWLVRQRSGLNKQSYPSMVADVERGLPTEIDEINGEIVRLGQLHGVATPVNAALTAMIAALENAPANTAAQPISPAELRSKLGL